jgi:hypothetical protein
MRLFLACRASLSCSSCSACDVGVGGVLRGLVGAAAFQQRDHREDLVQVLLGHLGHEAAAPRLVPHHALGREHLQRLAQRRARDAQRSASATSSRKLPGASSPSKMRSRSWSATSACRELWTGAWWASRNFL